MEYLDITHRLQDIREDIHELRSAETADITTKIDNLRIINRLLKEQNKLLAIKHKFFNIIKLVVMPMSQAKVLGPETR